MEWLSDPNAWVGLLTLTVLELVLGIDNIVFISILSGKLPAHEQKKARLIGLSMAMLMRILLLLSITWIMGLTRPLFAIAGFEVTGRAIILVVSGFVGRHPTIKMLALSFLLLIGMNLVAEGVGFHIPKGYTYFAMAFALFVEMLNFRMRSRKPAPRALQSRRLQKAIHRIEAPH